MTTRATPGRDRLARLAGPPLIVQLIGLIIGALVAAQLVTLLLTLVLPPAPPRRYALADIAAALRGPDEDGLFDRVVRAGPPDLSAPGWFVSTRARDGLAALLGRSPGEVALGFYTQLPVGGVVQPPGPPRRPPEDAALARAREPDVAAPDAPVERAAADGEVIGGETGVRLMPATLIQQMPGPPPGGGFPGGPPGGGFPGAGLPGGGFPQSLPQPRPMIQPQIPTIQRPQPQPQPQARPPSPLQARPSPQTAPAPATTPSTVPSQQAAQPARPLAVGPAQPGAGAVGGSAGPFGSPQDSGPVRPMANGGPPMPVLRAAPLAEDAPRLPDRTIRKARPAPALPDRSAERPPARATEQSVVAAGAAATDSAPRTAPGEAATAGSTSTAAPDAAARNPIAPTPAPDGRPAPILRPSPGLFGLAPAPFVEGDFIAAVRRTDGRWTVVGPRAEGFPSAWQRRVALWFLLSLLAVAPVAWAFARRIVGPLNAFAHAAEVLGRDPGAAVLPLDGPAEIGRAAHAFNQMQSRLRGFVDDRTAMIGAISHDLRTPLTRLRFRIEDVPEDQQEDLRGEVAEMEAMISSVIAFMRDASTPGARERRDLAEIVDDVVEDAKLLGDVSAGRLDSAMVDVDPLGIRRVLDNLLGNAMKYGGGRARVALRVRDACAVADIVDAGPGVSDEEVDRLFEPFYRSEDARRSGREGSGLGLAVCRSIARAHGGDVALFRSPDGFTARVTLPLAYQDDRRAA